jgi:hypothetical protein
MQLSTLAQGLRDRHESTLIQQAELIRDWPRGRERNEQAMIHIRLALSEQCFGRISQATQARVYSLLSFAMPDDATFTDEPTPIAELQREAADEAAYYEQLERQSCPECGDGICPVDEQCAIVVIPAAR